MPDGTPEVDQDVEEPIEAEEFPQPLPRIEFVWSDLVEADEATVDPRSISLTLRNVGPDPLFIEAFAATDNAERPVRTKLAEFDLGVAEELQLAVDATVGGTVDTTTLKYSGSATVVATARSGDGTDYGLFVSPTMFYHPTDDGNVLLYLEDTLRNEFRSGDYKNTHGDAFLEDGVVLDRVVYGGEGEVQPLGTPIAQN